MSRRKVRNTKSRIGFERLEPRLLLATLASDDFSSGTLNSELWEFVNPLGDATVQLTGAGTADARLEIQVPAGTNHEPWTVNRAPRVMQPTDDTDFEIMVKFDSPLTERYQEQGIIVEQDSGNYLRFDLHSNGQTVNVYAASISNSSVTNRIFQQTTVTAPMYFGVTRVGAQWNVTYSDDGADWTFAGSFQQALSVSQVGVFAGNYAFSGNSPEHTALVDYFFATTVPVIPDDGPANTAPTVAVPIANVTVSENAANTVIDLFTAFDDAQDPDTALVFSVQSNNNPGLFDSTEIDVGSGTLTLDYAANVSGTANLSVRATDTAGLSVFEPFQVVVNSSGGGGGGGGGAERPISDDFSSGALDQGLWAFVNPRGDSAVRVTGAGTADARLEIQVPGGSSHEPWNVNQAPRVMQAVADTDFTLEVKFDSALTQGFQEQGIIIEQDGRNYLRFDFHSDGSSVYAYAAGISNSSAATKLHRRITESTPMYMRVTRVWDLWTLHYSGDGENWVSVGSFSESLAVAQAGVFAGNYASGGSAPPHTALVDYFFERNSRIVPEDNVSGAPWITAPIADVTVPPNAPNTVIDVFAAFEDGQDPDTALAFTVQSNDNPTLFDSTNIDGLAGTLTLDYAANASGTANLTLRVTDSGGLFAEQAFRVVINTPGGPLIDVWYGSEQEFGRLGTPQKWANILGSVSDPDGVAALSYSLNGGPNNPLTIGPDTRRLESPGDFNVDLAIVDLQNGPNQVVITATDALNNISSETVNLVYSAGTVWPSSYTIDWSGVSDIQDVAQVVDGLWTVTGDTVTSPAIDGYDRLLAIGDRTWDDYEVTVPITIQASDVRNPQNICGCAAVGFLVRWQGHSVWDSSQPAHGYFPLGALALYRWDGNHSRLWMAGNNYEEILSDGSGKTLVPGVTYMFKVRAETTPATGGSLYLFKTWRQGDAEPSDWDLSLQTGAEDLSSGSLLLLSHYVNATFGRVTITADGNSNTRPIVAQPIAAVAVPVNAANTVIDLFAAFDDAQDADTALTYSVQTNDNSGLFDSTVINRTTGSLTLDYAADAQGTANITIRATDTGGLFVDATFTVTVSPAPTGNGLLGHWDFSDNNGDNRVDDSSGNGNHGTVHGPSFSSGALDFDGRDDYVNLGGLDVNGNGLTISAWINADSFVGTHRDGRIVSKARGIQTQDHYWMLSTIRDGAETRLRFRLKTAGHTDTLIADSGNLSVGQWYHVAAVYDGSFMRLYLDGVQVGQLAKSGTVDVNAGVAAWIGRNPSHSKPFAGLIDDVQISGRGLSGDEIQQLARTRR